MAHENLIAATSPGKQLGQARPGNSTAVTIYSPGANVITEITHVIVVETSGNADTFRLFHDEDGTTYSEVTALFWDEAIAADTSRTITFERGVWMRDSSGNFAVRSATASRLTFTVYGIEPED